MILMPCNHSSIPAYSRHLWGTVSLIPVEKKVFRTNVFRTKVFTTKVFRFLEQNFYNEVFWQKNSDKSFSDKNRTGPPLRQRHLKAWAVDWSKRVTPKPIKAIDMHCGYRTMNKQPRAGEILTSRRGCNEKSSTRKLVNPNICQPEYSLTQIFVDPNIRRPYR
jgi:hypothetical protein